MRFRVYLLCGTMQTGVEFKMKHKMKHTYQQLTLCNQVL